MGLKTRVHVDATAAKSMVERRGISRVRHIQVDHLWIQEQEARRMLSISKVDGGDKPSDLMTKNVGITFAMEHMTAMGIRFADGRSEAAVKLHHVEIKDEWKVALSGTNLNVMNTMKKCPGQACTRQEENRNTQCTAPTLKQLG